MGISENQYEKTKRKEKERETGQRSELAEDFRESSANAREGTKAGGEGNKWAAEEWA